MSMVEFVLSFSLWADSQLKQSSVAFVNMFRAGTKAGVSFEKTIIPLVTVCVCVCVCVEASSYICSYLLRNGVHRDLSRAFGQQGRSIIVK